MSIRSLTAGRSSVIAALAVVTLTLCTAHPASGAPTGGFSGSVVARVLDAEDPAAAYRSLSAADRAVFDRRMLPTESAVSVEVVAADAVARANADAGRSPDRFGTLVDGCWYARGWDSRSSAAGDPLYTFWTMIYYCAVGQTITEVSMYDSGSEILAPGWRHDGIKAQDTGVVRDQARGWAKHRFVLSTGDVDLWQRDHCIRVIGTYAGTQYSDGYCFLQLLPQQ
ncbi:hypothetical protein O7632_17705 [Solwaraspora sp. WMMD406]|uniref:hypothetical protein n=1 Tax=Solwaraspora sp. WMMD406 TaxID=3016095 RepID=UPI002416AAD9|nr:hypothetical protein [Solwaraspora sp. WMMD406]MDG4765920.1 hypothetical protein [Solwaraspora sp. WMMD406]